MGSHETVIIPQRIRSPRRPNGLKPRRKQANIRSARLSDDGKDVVLESTRQNRQVPGQPTQPNKKPYHKGSFKRGLAASKAKKKSKYVKVN